MVFVATQTVINNTRFMVEFPGNAWIYQMYTTIQMSAIFILLSLLQNAY